MASAVASSRETRATTVRIPSSVYEQAKHFVDSEKTNSSSRFSLNDFFVTAIQAYVKLYRRRQIDAAFAMMAEDANYQQESTLMAEEFEPSDWEALGLIEDSEEESRFAVSSTR